MVKTLLESKLGEFVRGESWSTIAPKKVYNSSPVECLSQRCSNLSCGGVICHQKYFGQSV